MSNLEHLIENTLVAMEDDSLCGEDIRERIENDANFPCTSLSVDDVWEICQYVKYTWCRDLENKLKEISGAIPLALDGGQFNRKEH